MLDQVLAAETEWVEVYVQRARVRKRLGDKERAIIDATPAQIADAVSRVENRKRQQLLAQNNLRRSSDQLKQLMNDPDLAGGSEVLLVPLDTPLDQAVQYSKLEALMTAMTYASIAAFAVACVAYVVVRYVLFPRRRERVTRRA